MSHRDVVAAPPAGFRVLATTSTCETAAIEDAARRSTACSSTPKWCTPPRALRILENFVFDICGCEKDWNAGQRIALIEDEIRARAGDRNVFFFVSGGVDSTVAFTLCLRGAGVRARARRLCRYRPDARRRNRIRRAQTFRGLRPGPNRRLRAKNFSSRSNRCATRS